MTNLILIPGLLSNKTLWEPVLQAFKNNYSSEIIDVASCKSIEELSQSICKKINKEIVLIGFSLGAWVALNTYSILPHYCKALILISSAPGCLTTETQQHFLTYLQQISSGNFEEFIKNDYEKDISESNKNNQELKNTLMSMMKNHGSKIAINQLNAMLTFKSDFSNLSYVHCPTLLIRGIDDQSINIKRQEEILNEIKDASLAIIPNSAHYIPLENPKAIASIMEDWLHTKGL
ncbi:MAG: alpha/beta hydrolase [Gammaproteobacteria bacterium]|nr:alpha/beta hydrolase [Gammaproteobacteria bacterium]MCW5584139.1 alpha/beta hydrolase [Gammaproteobacteria bacterium]